MARVRDRIITAAREIAAEKPVKEISISELSRASGVSWPTVRRHVGGPKGLSQFLEDEGAEILAPTEADSPSVKAANTRSRILLAAFQVFSSQGYSGATLDDVAAEAGLTKGAVYWHFTSKDDLCMALIEERFRSESIRIPASIREAVRDGGGQQAIFTFLAEEVRQAREAEPWRQLGLEFMSRSRSPAIRKRYADLADKIYRDTVPVAESLVENGVFAKDQDIEAFVIVWRCLLLGMGLWMTQDPKGMDFERLAPRLAQVIWRGMSPVGELPSEPADNDTASKAEFQ